MTLFDELGSFKNVGLGEAFGGINILNKPNHYGINPITGKPITTEAWWTQYNKSWLDRAIDRSDDVYLATIPTKSDEIIKDGNLLGAYAYELKHLVDREYKPINLTAAQWDLIKSWF